LVGTIWYKIEIGAQMYQYESSQINLKNIFNVGMLFVLILNPLAGISQVAENIMDLDHLIYQAINKNPQLKSFRSATQADSTKVPQSGSLPDPILSFNILNLPTNSFAFDQEPMTGKQIALRQIFPFPGKLGLKEEISAENVDISIANYEEYKNQIIRDVKITYFDLFFIDKSITITTQNQQLLLEFAKIAETKYSVGKGIHQDVLKAQVEYSKMSDKLIQLEQRREENQAKMNKLINASANSKLGKTNELVFIPLNVDPDTLYSRANKYRPLIKAWKAIRKQSSLKVQLAKKDYWPDIGLFVAYTQREELQSGNPGHDFLSGGISLNIPLYSGGKQSKRVEETQYSKNMIDERYAEVQNQIYMDLETSRSNAYKNARLVDLFKTDIIPQAEQSVESALVGYQTDKVDFLTLISNQITLFNYNLDYYRVLSEYKKDTARLEFLTGVQLSNHN
jgi:outer membrane protein TolC